MRERDQYPFEKFSEPRELGSLTQVEGAWMGCPQETKRDLGHWAFLIAGTDD